MGVDIMIFVKTNDEDETNCLIRQLKPYKNLFFDFRKLEKDKWRNITHTHGFEIMCNARYSEFNEDFDIFSSFRMKFATETIKKVKEIVDNNQSYYGHDLQDSPVWAKDNDEFDKLLSYFQEMNDDFMEIVDATNEYYKDYEDI